MLKLEQAPNFFTESFPHKESYWTVRGKSTGLKVTPGSVRYSYVYYSKEEAEADAASPSECWVWNKLPAILTSLQETMDRARAKGFLGVKVKAFQDGKWVTVKEYLCCEPLPIELRGTP